MACHVYTPGHYGTTMSGVNCFVQKHSFVDVKFICKNKKTVYSHKLILASASTFLKAVIKEMDNFDDIITVYLPDFDYNIVTLLLTFLCEGIMKLKLEELEEFRELCNELCMSFPDAVVVKLPNNGHGYHSSTVQHANDVVSAHSLVETEREIRDEKSSFVASTGAQCSPGKIPAKADTHDAVASIIPKIYDYEECQNSHLVQHILDNELQNTRNMLDHGVINNDIPQAENHGQISYETDENLMYSETTSNTEPQKTVMHQYSGTPPDINLWHGTSNSALEISQNTKMLQMNSSQSMSVPTDEANFHSSYSCPVRQASNSQLIMKQPKSAPNNFSNGLGVEQAQFTQILDSSSVHNKLLEKIRDISCKRKQSACLKRSSARNDTKVHSKQQSVLKSVPAKRGKRSD